MPYGSLGLRESVFNLWQMQQAKRKQRQTEIMAQLERDVAERKFRADEAYRKQYLALMEKKAEPGPTKFEKYETEGAYGAFDPTTGEYIQKGEMPAKAEDFKTFKERTLMENWNRLDQLTPQQQKALGLSVSGKAGGGYTMAQAIDDARAAAGGGKLTSQQENENLIAILQKEPPPHVIKKPTLQEVFPKAESLYSKVHTGEWPQEVAGGQGSWAENLEITKMPGRGGLSVPDLTPKEKEVAVGLRQALIENPGQVIDWNDLANFYPNIDIEKVKNALGVQ